MINIVNYFYLEEEANQSEYGVGEKNYKKKNEYYLRCIINFFNSSIKYNKNCVNWMITNDIEKLNKICEIDLIKFCDKYGIKLVQKESKNVIKLEKWAGSMFFFDAIEVFKENFVDEDKYFFFDNDVFFTKNIEDIFNEEFDYLVYDITHEYCDGDEWLDFNGIDISRQEIDFKPYGGEFFGVKGKKIEEFLDEYNRLKIQNNELKTEEHYISMILREIKKRNDGIVHANDYIKRCWTTLKYKNISKNDYLKPILHIPSEKEYGIYWYSKKIKKPSEFESKEILSICGITERKFIIKIKIIAKKIMKRFRK